MYVCKKKFPWENAEHRGAGWPDWANFLPMGVIVYFCSFYESSLTFWTIFTPRQNFWITCDKNGLGYILGNFYANSSGRPAEEYIGTKVARCYIFLPIRVNFGVWSFGIFYIHTANKYFVWPFCILCGHLEYSSQFWYVEPRKIWQPWSTFTWMLDELWMKSGERKAAWPVWAKVRYLWKYLSEVIRVASIEI
jgi:hypothetical protein